MLAPRRDISLSITVWLGYLIVGAILIRDDIEGVLLAGLHALVANFWFRLPLGIAFFVLGIMALNASAKGIRHAWASVMNSGIVALSLLRAPKAFAGFLNASDEIALAGAVLAFVFLPLCAIWALVQMFASAAWLPGRELPPTKTIVSSMPAER